MKVNCYIPRCRAQVEISGVKWFFKCLFHFLRNSRWACPVACPVHLERLTAGRISDGDDTTNPDLNKK